MIALSTPYRPQLHITGPSEGRALVLGNSLGTDTRLWRSQVAVWSKKNRVVCFDYPGHGDAPMASLSNIGDIAAGLLASLDDAGIHTFAYCGISMGAAAGIELAAMAPDRVSSLILANTAASFGPSEFWQARIDKSRAEGMSGVAEQTVSRWIREEHARRDPALVAFLTRMFCDTRVEGYVQCCQAVRQFDASPLLASVSAPTLIIAGSHDRATTVAQAHVLHQGIRDSRCTELAGAHLSNLDDPNAFNALVDAHLSQ